MSDPLYKALKGSLVTSSLGELQFLPRNLVKDNITVDAIEPYLSFWSRIWKRVSNDNLARQIHEQASKVFAILVLIDKPSAIQTLFSRHGLTDKHLPLQSSSPNGEHDNLVSSITGKTFPSFDKWGGLAALDRFLEKQYLVIAPSFDKIGQALQLHRNHPLPFVECVWQASGSDGVSVHHGKLHSSYQLPALAAAPRDKIAIKEIPNKKAFDREKANLERIQSLNHRHLISLIGSCEKDTINYFFFPWAAGGNLRELWQRLDGHEPRRLWTPQTVMWALDQMLGLVDAIRILHDIGIRHGDIKPQNILHFPDSTHESGQIGGRLVLADVGVSKFHHEATALRNEATNTRDATISYEAPEAASEFKNGKPRPRRYDMWSLGCMSLEFVVWLLYGFEAVETFRKQRMPRRGDPRTAPGNFFTEPTTEDGPATIHSKVTRAISLLRHDSRCHGDDNRSTAMGDLINLIEKDLLQIDPERRAHAPVLHTNLDRIVQQARQDPQYLCRLVDPSPEIPRFFTISSSRRGSKTSTGKFSSSSSPSASSYTGSSFAPTDTGRSRRSSVSSVSNVGRMSRMSLSSDFIDEAIVIEEEPQ
ncbi:kinase-like domain-containing protein [Triangularia verruculosa]|uniref:Kinase-like domain-containing protein n=1 Tax=Triangularia verruculosa TaxID=2587418 RepID=A0AAN6XQQ6_9PEZI|nr:kinase-like domain-containing protein [Triangularia verruculosa]